MKYEILALIKMAQKKAEIVNLDNLSIEQRMNIEKIIANLDEHYEYVSTYLTDDNTELAEKYTTYLNKLNSDLDAIHQEYATDITSDLEEKIISQTDSQIEDHNNDEKSDIEKDMENLLNEEDLEEDKEEEKIHVVEVIPEEKLSEKEKKEIKKTNKIIAGMTIASIAAIVIGSVLLLKSCHVNRITNTAESINFESEATLEESEEETIVTPTVTPVPSPTPVEEETAAEVIAEYPINNIDLNNYEELLAYAESLYNKLPEDTNMTIDDIMYALRLANIDYLDEQDCFSDRESVCRSTYMIGELSNEIGSNEIIQRRDGADIYISEDELRDMIMSVVNNEITPEAFATAKTQNGYDIYNVTEICVRNMNAENDKNMQYGMLLNEIVARATHNFTIVEESPVQTMYALLGIYNANGARIDELTSGKGFGPIYGNGARIDGTYGDICVEELRSFAYIDHENEQYIGSDACIFYAEFADEILINQENAQENAIGSR